MKKKLAVLLAKIGLFFANCDGEYCPLEEQFINNFINNLKRNNCIDDKDSEAILDAAGTQITIEEIVEEMNNFVKELKENERGTFVSSIDEYIKGIIKSDRFTQPEEKKYLDIWEKRIII